MRLASRLMVGAPVEFHGHIHTMSLGGFGILEVARACRLYVDLRVARRRHLLGWNIVKKASEYVLQVPDVLRIIKCMEYRQHFIVLGVVEDFAVDAPGCQRLP